MTLPVFVPTDDLLTITATVTGDQAVRLSLIGEVDTYTAPRLATALDQVLTTEGLREVTVDLAGVRFLGAAGVHALTDAARAVVSVGGRLRAVAARPAVRRPMQISGLWSRIGDLAPAGQVA